MGSILPAPLRNSFYRVFCCEYHVISCFGRDERISINGKISLLFVTQLPFYIRRTAKRKRPLPYFSSAAGTCSRKHGIFRRAVFLYQLPQAGQVPSDQAALKKEAEVRCRVLQRDKVSLFLYDILSLSAGGIAKKMQTKKERMIPFLSSRNHYFL